MNITKILITFYISLALISCREYEIYTFKEVSIPTNQGMIEFEITPSRQLAGEKKAIEANPYSLLFKYHSTAAFDSFTISEISIGDLKFKPVPSLSSSTEPTGFTKHSEHWAIASLTSQLQDIELKHQEYKIAFKLTLITNEQSISESFSVKVKPEFRKEHKNDSVQAAMGI